MADSHDVPNTFLYGRQAPWPQPSPTHPETCAPEVLNVPLVETAAFDLYIGLRYAQALSSFPPYGAEYVRWIKTTSTFPQPWRPTDVGNRAFDTIMYQTLYTRFLKKLSSADTQRLSQLGIKPQPGWLKYDFTAMNLLQPVRGTYCAATVLIVDTSSTNWSSVGILLSPIPASPQSWIFVRKGDPAWALAQAFVLQGAAYHVLFVVHPAIHFPMNSVNAITKAAVPTSHPLYQLLLPHSAYQLALDSAVLESSLSVVNDNSYRTYWDPLTADASTLRRLFGAGYAGLTESHGYAYDPEAYPRYDYMQPVKGFPSWYGQWLDAYFQPFLTFCGAVANVMPNDKYVTRWAGYIANALPTFPNGSQIYQSDNLAKALATYMWNNSVAHGGDHYSFTYQINVIEKCLRIRVPPPTSASAPDPGTPICTEDDLARAALCQWMFFHPWAVYPNLNDTMYAFTDATCAAAAAQFKTDLGNVKSPSGPSAFPMPLAPPASLPDPAPDPGGQSGAPVAPPWPLAQVEGILDGGPGYPVTIPQSIQY